MDAGQPVCLPVVLGDEQPLELRLWEQGAPLYEAGFGTLAPADSAPRVEPDVILMPLLGFDRHGTRLGYGGGYYDRTLAPLSKRPRLVGFAFAAQELDLIPREAHDVPLDAIVTEAGVRHFGRRPPHMRLLFLGDVVGRSGRDAVTDRLPGSIAELQLRFRRGQRRECQPRHAA